MWGDLPNQGQLSWDSTSYHKRRKQWSSKKHLFLLLQGTNYNRRLTQAVAKKDWLSRTARSPGWTEESFLAIWQNATEVTVHFSTVLRNDPDVSQGSSPSSSNRANGSHGSRDSPSSSEEGESENASIHPITVSTVRHNQVSLIWWFLSLSDFHWWYFRVEWETCMLWIPPRFQRCQQ